MNSDYLVPKYSSQKNGGSEKLNFIIALFFIMLYMLAFDFRSISGSGKSILIFMGLVSLLSGGVLIFLLKYLNKSAVNMALPVLAFTIVSSVSGIVRGQLVYDVISMSLPLIMFTFALLSTSSIRIKPEKFKHFLDLLIVFCFLSVVFKLIFGFIYYGLTLENARYQIISPTLILVFSYGVASMFYKKQKWGYIAISLSFLVVFLSVTRTYLVVYLGVVIFWVLCAPLKYWLKYIRFAVKLVLLLILLILTVYGVFPDVFDRWVVRLFTGVAEHGVDVTAITRIAEMEYQVGKLLESPMNLITGLGIAAETRFSPEYIDVLRIVYPDDYEYIGKGYGHNTYIGIVFTGGNFVGGGVIFTIIKNLVVSIKFFKREIRANKYISDYHFAVAWGGAAALGYSTYGLLGGTFGDRLASLSFGVAFGLVLLGKKFILQSIHRV